MVLRYLIWHIKVLILAQTDMPDTFKNIKLVLVSQAAIRIG